MTIRRRLGFSLAELLVAIGLSVVLMGLTLAQFRTGVQSAGAHGLALELAARLRGLRASAISTQSPLFLGLPSGSGVTPVAHTLYLARGSDIGQPCQLIDYSVEYPNQVLFFGVWPLQAGGPGWTTGPIPFSKANLPDPANWLDPSLRADPGLVFTPSGTVNGYRMASSGGDYHILVASGITAQSSSLAGIGPGYFEAVTTGEAWTVTCGSSGSVRVDSGIVGQNGGVTIQPSVGLNYAFGTPPLVSSATGNVSITSLVINPQDASGVCKVGPGESVALCVNATSDVGSDLYLTWTGTGGGAFSSSGELKMNWDSGMRVWTSIRHWTAPVGFAPGANVTLTCSVRNAKGALANSSASLSPQVGGALPGKMLFVDHVGNLCLAHVDGGGCHTILPWLSRFQPVWSSLSRDGAVITLQDAFFNGYVADLSGRRLACLGTGMNFPTLSPNYKKLSFFTGDAVIGVADLQVSDAGGTNISLAFQFPLIGGHTNEIYSPVSWSPDSQQMSYLHCHDYGGAAGNVVHVYTTNISTNVANTNEAYARNNTVPGCSSLIPVGPVSWNPNIHASTPPLLEGVGDPGSGYSCLPLALWVNPPPPLTPNRQNFTTVASMTGSFSLTINPTVIPTGNFDHLLFAGNQVPGTVFPVTSPIQAYVWDTSVPASAPVQVTPTLVGVGGLAWITCSP